MDADKFSYSGCGVPLSFALSRKAAPAKGPGSEPRNRLLAALPREALLSLQAHFKPVSLPRGRVLCEADEPLTWVYFVETGIVSLVAVLGDRTSAVMATVGREGMIGIGALLSGEQALGRYVVSMPVRALAVEASRFRSALRRNPSLCATCEAYARAFLREALQTAACNSVHMVEERCARWLLISGDRSNGEILSLTQGYLAEILGVCRSTVTIAAGALQRAGLISCRRGAIVVLDRPGLERASCECYRIIRNQYEEFLPKTYEPALSERQPSHLHEPGLSRAFG
jgi:CRP-like cAMP-binding protein